MKRMFKTENPFDLVILLFSNITTISTNDKTLLTFSKSSSHANMHCAVFLFQTAFV